MTDDLDPRERLIHAGPVLIDELPLSKAFAGLTTARIAAAAGVTTGSFFHHFANHAGYVDALVRSTIPEPVDMSQQVDEMVGALAYMDLLEMLKASLQESWDIGVSEPGLRRQLRFQMALWANHTKALAEPFDGMERVGDVLRASYRVRQVQAAAGWHRLCDATDRSIAEPFDAERLASVMIALYEGLMIRQQIDPEAVEATMFYEIAATIATALTFPRGSRVRLADLAEPLTDDSGLSPQARVGARRRRETRRRIVESVTGSFDEGWEDVSASDLAETADVAHQTVLNLFDTVREVAASTFVRHLPVLRDVADETTDDDPVTALYLVLSRLAELATDDPEPARALLEERIRAKLHRGGELAEMDIRLEVPVVQMLLRSLERMDLDGEEPIQYAAMLCDTTLLLALDRVGPHRDVAAMAIRLLPPAATGARVWTPPRTASDRRQATG